MAEAEQAPSAGVALLKLNAPAQSFGLGDVKAFPLNGELAGTPDLLADIHRVQEAARGQVDLDELAAKSGPGRGAERRHRPPGASRGPPGWPEHQRDRPHRF